MCKDVKEGIWCKELKRCFEAEDGCADVDLAHCRLCSKLHQVGSGIGLEDVSDSAGWAIDTNTLKPCIYCAVLESWFTLELKESESWIRDRFNQMETVLSVAEDDMADVHREAVLNWCTKELHHQNFNSKYNPEL